ncbi:hypothetical protein CNMCM5623_002012 [Aspergillus felis]|nr:hypothetical protein CNMCM5623_002012 [Aspergillus felis]
MDASSDDKIKGIVAMMSAENGTERKPTLANAVSTLNNTATGISHIMDNFDKVLRHPYLDQFSATLNTVPVVGLKDQTIRELWDWFVKSSTARARVVFGIARARAGNKCLSLEV